jgi:hypothetical protein
LTVEEQPLLDIDTRLLRGSTEVRGREAGERGARGFVPEDRLIVEEEHFTAYDLPETME